MRRPHRRCIRTVCGRPFAAGPSEGGHEAPTLAPQGTRAKTWAARAAALSTTRRKIDVINASRGVKNTDGPNANRESSMRKRRAGRSRRRARAGARAGAGAAGHSAPLPHHDLRHVSTLAPELGVHVVLTHLVGIRLATPAGAPEPSPSELLSEATEDGPAPAPGPPRASDR